MFDIINGESFNIDRIVGDDDIVFSNSFSCYAEIFIFRGTKKIKLEEKILGERNIDGSFSISIPSSKTLVFTEKTIVLVTVFSDKKEITCKKELFFNVNIYG